MNKNTFFTGQPIFSQILNLIPRDKIFKIAQFHNADRYCKKFFTYDHLISMLYCIYSGCTSIREVTTGLLACESKLDHLGLKYSVPKSTLSDSNIRRDEKVFCDIYQALYKKYAPFLPDSQSKNWFSRLYIFDSTTISLFQEIMKCAGNTPMNGKRKGGVKAHTLIKADENVPKLVDMTSAATADTSFMKYVQLPAGSIVTFDKGYNNYNIFANWSNQSVSFVTRLRKVAVFEIIKVNPVSDAQNKKGVTKDIKIILGHTSNNITRFEARIVYYHDQETGNNFEFLTNNMNMAPATIAQIYKYRWRIEGLFKRIKQNYPLQYFLGDNENAIKIQIWCALIADLLLQFLRKRIKRKWAFSNLTSMIRLHLMNYVHLVRFLENPERAFLKNKKRQSEKSLKLAFVT
jgi:hypothetical protein